MLVLKRRIDERTFIEVPASDAPTQIEVCVVDIRHGDDPHVRLGFEAPTEVGICRDDARVKR